MFVAQTHSFDIHKSWLWSIHIATLVFSFLLLWSNKYIFDLFSSTLKIQRIIWPRCSSCSASASAIYHVFPVRSVSVAFCSLLVHSSWPTCDFSRLRHRLRHFWSPILGPSLSCGGVGAHVGSSQEQPGAVTCGKSVIVPNTKTSYRAFCCALIGG